MIATKSLHLRPGITSARTELRLLSPGYFHGSIHTYHVMHASGIPKTYPRVPSVEEQARRCNTSTHLYHGRDIDTQHQNISTPAPLSDEYPGNPPQFGAQDRKSTLASDMTHVSRNRTLSSQ